VKVIIYGDFNCLYCYLASQRADRLVRAGITAEVITYPGGGGHQRHLLGRPSRPAGWESVFGFFSRDLSG
jgi:hypothetical protein